MLTYYKVFSLLSVVTVTRPGIVRLLIQGCGVEGKKKKCLKWSWQSSAVHSSQRVCFQNAVCTSSEKRQHHDRPLLKSASSAQRLALLSARFLCRLLLFSSSTSLGAKQSSMHDSAKGHRTSTTLQKSLSNGLRTVKRLKKLPSDWMRTEDGTTGTIWRKIL